jgi:UDP-N-acetylglucosamine 2-epimerase
MSALRLLSVVGARPQFVKLAPVVRAIHAHNESGGRPIENLIVHTGQHYDAGMSEVFFDELQLPQADFNLGVGSASHARQTATMLERIEPILLEQRPDVVVVYGDTNSTLAGALAATKEHIAVAHVEAGLRSFNRLMPEETNRIITDHVADLLLVPTETGMVNLVREGLIARARLTGDVMRDAVIFHRGLARQRSDVIARFGFAAGSFAVATLHRAENTAMPQLASALQGLAEVAVQALPVVLALHPRTAGRIAQDLPGWRAPSALRIVEPLSYLDMLALVDAAAMILTDSGGLQKEALFLGKPCITLREETEWGETVALGANVLAGVDPGRIMRAVRDWLARDSHGLQALAAGVDRAFGAGDAARRTIAAIVENF